MAVKIVKPEKNIYKSFAEVPEGEFFMHCNNLFIKLMPFSECDNSYDVKNIAFATFDENDAVLPVDVEIKIEL